MIKKVIKSNIACLIASLLLLMFSQKHVWAQLSEYILKAVYLERFARFVDWPEESDIADSSKPFIIAIIGGNPFRSDLEEIYAVQRIKNKKVIVRYISHTDAIEGCHLLFISKNKKEELSEIVSHTKDKPILTVSDTRGFANKGVYINFYLEKNKLRFEINESAVRHSKLRMSYMLLQQAKILNPPRE